MPTSNSNFSVKARIRRPRFFVEDLNAGLADPVIPHVIDIEHKGAGMGNTGSATIKVNDIERNLLGVYKIADEIKIYESTTDLVAHVLVWGGYIDSVEYDKENKFVLLIKCKGYAEGFKRREVTGRVKFSGNIDRDAHVLLDDRNSTINIGGNEFLAQSFTPTFDTDIAKFKVWMKYWTGTAGLVTAGLYNDAAGSPDMVGGALDTVVIPAFTDTWAWREFLFENHPPLVKDTTYWVVLDSIPSSTTRTYLVGADTDDNYIDGFALFSDNVGVAWNNPNTNEWWNEIATAGANNIGQFPSIVFDSNGIIHIFHRDATAFTLRHTYGVPGNFNDELIDAAANLGEWTACAIDSNGIFHVSYYDLANTALKHMYGTPDATGSLIGGTFAVETIDNTAAVGEYTDICIASDDTVHISYYDATGTSLKHAYGSPDSTGSILAGITLETVDTGGVNNVGLYTSIAVDSGDWIHISYFDLTNLDVLYASGNGIGGTWTLEQVDNNAVAHGTSIITDKNDIIHILYLDLANVLTHAYKSIGVPVWLTEVIDNINVCLSSFGHGFQVDSKNNLHVAYHAVGPGELWYAYGPIADDGSVVANWSVAGYTFAADTGPNVVGEHPAIYMENDNSHIAHKDGTVTDLKYTEFFATNTRDTVFESYMYPTNVSGIFKTLCEGVVNDLGFTTVNVDNFSFIPEISEFEGRTLFNSLNEVAKMVDARWWADVNKDIYLKAKTALPGTADVLDDGAGGNIRKINRKIDKEKFCNVAIVKGKSNTSESISATDNKTYADATKTAGVVYSEGDNFGYLNMPDGFLHEVDTETVVVPFILDATTIKITDANNDFPYAGVVKIDDELIAYSGVSGECLFNCIRGTNGTVVQKHFNGAKVSVFEVFQNFMVSNQSDNFNDDAIHPAWTNELSGASAGTGCTEINQQLEINAEGNAYAHLEKAYLSVDDEITIVSKLMVSGLAGGVDWGVGIALYWDVDNWAKVQLSMVGANLKASFTNMTAGVPVVQRSVANLNNLQWYWLKLKAEANGNNFEGFYSLDGITWISLGNDPRNIANAPALIIIGKGYSQAPGFPNPNFDNDNPPLGLPSDSWIDGFTIFKNHIPYVELNHAIKVDSTASFAATGQITVNDEVIDYTSVVGTQFRCPTCRIGTRKGSILGRGNSNGSVMRHIKDDARIVDNFYTKALPEALSSISTYGIHKRVFTNLELDNISECYTFGDRIVDAFDDPDNFRTYEIKTNALLTDVKVHDQISVTSVDYGLAANFLEVTKLTHKLNRKGMWCELELDEIVPTLDSMVSATEIKGMTQDSVSPISMGDVFVVNKQENTDANFPLDMRVYIPDGTQEVKKVWVNYGLEKYRFFDVVSVSSLTSPAATQSAIDIGFGPPVGIAFPNSVWLIWAAVPVNTSFIEVFVSFRERDAITAMHLPEWAIYDATTLTYYPALVAGAGVSTHCMAAPINDVHRGENSVMLKAYGNFVGNRLELHCRDLAGANTTLFLSGKAVAYLSTTATTVSAAISEQAGAFPVTDIGISINGIDKTAEIEAELGHTLEFGESRSEKNIDITRYVQTPGLHTITITPDDACRIDGSVYSSIRYSY